MLRTLALALLLANALLLVAQLGVFDPLMRTGAASQSRQREPERLARQLKPERVRILTPDAASTAISAAAASTAAAASQAAEAARNALVKVCLQAGPLAPPDADAITHSLREAGLAATDWTAQKSDGGGDYMVYMGRYPDREAWQRKHDQLKRMHIDTEDLRQMPEYDPGLSLGHFESKAAADTALARFVMRGVRTARIETLRPSTSQTTLRIKAADGALRARLAGPRLPAGKNFETCPGTPTLAAALAASSAAASSVAAAKPDAASASAATKNSTPGSAPAPTSTLPPEATPPSRASNPR